MGDEATYDFTYTEAMYREYFSCCADRAANARRLKLFFWYLILTFVCVWAIAVANDSAVSMLSGTILTAGASFLGFTEITGPSRQPTRGQMRAFFERHGVDVASSAHWEFRERVEIGESGIKVSFGPVGCSDESLTAAGTKPWSAWERASVADSLIVVARRKDASSRGHGGKRKEQAETAPLPEGPGEHEDAVIPLELLQGVDAKEYARWMRSHSSKAHRQK